MVLETTTILIGDGPDNRKPLIVRKDKAIRYFVYAMHWLKRLYDKDIYSFRLEHWKLDTKNSIDSRKIG